MNNPIDESRPDEILARMRKALRSSMKRRDKMAIAGVRSAMAAVANAEAVDVDDATSGGAIEASSVGVGSTEVARHVLTGADVHAIIEAEATEREHVAEGHAARGDRDRADWLRGEAAAIRDAIADEDFCSK